MYDGKELERGTPYRFLNLPPSVTLELLTGSEAKLGVQCDAKGTTDKRPDTQVVEKSAIQRGLSKGSTVSRSKTLEIRQDHSKIIPAIYIFSRRREIELLSDVDTSSIDYEVNQSDVLLLQSSLTRKNRTLPLKTSQIREKELQQKMDTLGPVQLRIEFPVEMIVQFELPVNSPVSLVYDILQQHVISEGVDIDSMVLFTTPPKRILENKCSLTLYEVGLYPAARVRVALPERYQTIEEIFSSHALKNLDGLPPGRTRTDTADGQTLGPTEVDKVLDRLDDPKRASRTSVAMPKWFAKR